MNDKILQLKAFWDNCTSKSNSANTESSLKIRNWFRRRIIITSVVVVIVVIIVASVAVKTRRTGTTSHVSSANSPTATSTTLKTTVPGPQATSFASAATNTSVTNGIGSVKQQTTFVYPRNGSGITIPFPSELAKLTGLNNWPTRWVTPPFTPNMNATFNPSATAILPDVVAPPQALFFVQTFDDGPTNVTSTLLDYLDSVNQKTTFFEIGSQVADNYLLTQREYASGHQIADHTWSHPDLTQLSPEQVYAELLWTIYVIQASIGQIPKYFRPPYGFINNNVRTVAAQLNLTAVVWNHDTNDWQIGTNSAYTVNGVLSTVSSLLYSVPQIPTLLLEHDFRAATVQVGISVSQMILNATGRVNCPVAAFLGDAQRYQGTNLTWPVVENNKFVPSFNPINGTFGSPSQTYSGTPVGASTGQPAIGDKE